MTFDIPSLHIDSASPEGQVVEGIIRREHVTPEEAVLRALRGFANGPAASDEKPGELLFGLFSDGPELMSRIAEEARGARDREAVKEFSA